MTFAIRTLRLRIKDRHAKQLRSLADEVNMVWNWAQNTAVRVFERERRFMTAYDFHPLAVGATKCGLSLHSQTVKEVVRHYVQARYAAKKIHLKERNEKSLGWIPLTEKGVRYRDGRLLVAGVQGELKVWDSYGLGGYELHGGSIAQDSKGRWFISLRVRVALHETAPREERPVGIDLGLATLATLSDGTKVNTRQFYRAIEPALAVAQRARKSGRARALNARARNQRCDYIHKATTEIVQRYTHIYVGDVSASAVRRRFGKSCGDVAWGAFRRQLAYKAETAAVHYALVDESFSSQTCSACKTRSGHAKGIAGLGIRQWTCQHCGAVHDRDVNAARNIAAAGHGRLAEGSPAV